MSPTSGRRTRLAAFDDAAEKLAAAFWPGPLTLVLQKARRLARSRSSPPPGLDSIAVRVPDHPVARGILRALGRPVVAPSANRSGHVSPTTAAHVLADLARPHRSHRRWRRRRRSASNSTIVACLDRPMLLRPGGAPREAIERALGAAACGRLRRRPPMRRSRPACWRRTTRRARGCGSTPARCAPARRCWRSAPAAGGRRTRDARAQSFACRRPGRGRRQSVLASARARRPQCDRNRCHARSRGRSRRGDQRPACACRRAKRRLTDAAIRLSVLHSPSHCRPYRRRRKSAS